MTKKIISSSKSITKSPFLISLLFAIIIFEIIGFCLSIPKGGLRIFIYYTELSNFLTFISAIFLLIGIKKNKFPKALIITRFTSSCMLLMTALITIFVLVPSGEHSIDSLLLSPLDIGFYHHLICPCLSIASYIFFEPHINNYPSLLAPLSMTILYGIVTLILNLAYVINGPYPFLRVYDQPISTTILWFSFLILFVLFLSWVIMFLSKKVKKSSPVFRG